MQSGQTPAGTDRICFLHIGPHKTGTTSIQAALFHNAKRLAPLGVAYPTVTDPGSGRQRRNHTPLMRASNFRTADLREAPFWQEIERKIADHDGSIVISTEHMAETLKDTALYDRVTGFFRRVGYRIVVVAYIRDQPSLLNSWYTQDQRNFMSRMSFQEFRDHAIERGLLDPCAFLKNPIDDPQAEIRVISFERAVKEGLARSFFSAIGVPADFEVVEPTATNANLGVKGVYAAQEIMRRVEGRIRSMPNYNDLYESFKSLMRDKDWAGTAYVGLTEDDVRVVRERYAASNDAFARQWFGADWETVCPPRPSTLRVFDPAAASAAELDEIHEVVDRMVELVRASPSVASDFIRADKAARKKGSGKGPNPKKGGGQKAAALPPVGDGLVAKGPGPKGPGPKGPGHKGQGPKGAGPKGQGAKGQGPKGPGGKGPGPIGQGKGPGKKKGKNGPKAQSPAVSAEG